MPKNSHGPVIVAVDQGTSATKAILVDSQGAVLSRASESLATTTPKPGWVEQDPAAILTSVRNTVQTASSDFEGVVAGIGFSTQRESALAWNRKSGEPVSPVLGWQDRRTAQKARSLSSHAERVRQLSGLPLDPMFSALKLSWILDDVDPDRSRSRSGELAIGTVDSWLLWNLTGEHRIEIGNASRTQLVDLATGAWSEELLELFDIPRECLPFVAASNASSARNPFPGTPLGAVLGDSHAAMYGHGMRTPGDVKVTYGTGSSVMGLTEEIVTGPGLVGTIGWGIDRGTNGEVDIARAFEGNILATGATVLWLSKLLGHAPDELDRLARTVADTGGVDIVPAFSGLAAPWWDENAVGIISGVHLGTSAAQLSRAAFESIVLQVEDVLRAAQDEVGLPIERIFTDGGPSRNSWLMQLQADISGRTVSRHDGADLSAIGAARLAAVSADVVAEDDPGADLRTEFTPAADIDTRARHARWGSAVARARATGGQLDHSPLVDTIQAQ